MTGGATGQVEGHFARQFSLHPQADGAGHGGVERPNLIEQAVGGGAAPGDLAVKQAERFDQLLLRCRRVRVFAAQGPPHFR